MTDKVQKIREEVEKLKSQLLRGACSSQIAMETMCKEEAYNEVLAILDTLKEEPVSEELEKAAEEYIKYTPRYDIEYELEEGNDPTEIDCFTIDEATAAFIAGAKWKKEQMMAKGVDGIVHLFGKCEVASVHYDDPTGVPMSYFMTSKGFLAGDKVKVIVIKED